jgi:DNA-binding NtrC family response regulator
MSEPVIRPPAGKPGKKVLIVDDEFLIRYSLQNLIEREGFSVITADSGLHALQQFEQEKPEIVILDIRLPDSNGLVLLKTMKEINPSVTVVMVTACPDIQSSVEAIKMGAFDYLDKPIDFEKLIGIMNTLKEERSQDQMGRPEDNLIFTSNAMKEVYRVTERLANKSDVTLLVLGESGTGKSFLCKTIHELSSRKGHPFVEIGCSTIPDHLIESELFGYEKGAFTDAKGSKKGLIDMAEGGTVFLDEIGDMPYAMQSKVLGLIEERKFRRVGGLQQINADVRILAATNKNLHDLVHEGKFRLDLYYRLNVVTIEMPPLRKRSEDIPLLLRYYISLYADRFKKTSIKGFSPEAEEILKSYDWPGNIRELRNLVERLVVLESEAEIQPQHLPKLLAGQQRRQPAAEASPAPNEKFMLPEDGISLDDVEKDLIRQALERSNYNKTQAAKLLKISYDTLRYQVKKFGLE